MVRLLEEIGERAGRLKDRGAARLIACGDPALAALIANDARTRRLCMRAGERHIVVPAASDRALATECFGRPVLSAGRSTLPGAAASRSLLVSGTTTAVEIRLALKLSP